MDVGCIWICLSTIRTQTLHLKGSTSIDMLLMIVPLGQVFDRWRWTRWCISVRDRHGQGRGGWWIVRFLLPNCSYATPMHSEMEYACPVVAVCMTGYFVHGAHTWVTHEEQHPSSPWRNFSKSGLFRRNQNILTQPLQWWLVKRSLNHKQQIRSTWCRPTAYW